MSNSEVRIKSIDDIIRLIINHYKKGYEVYFRGQLNGSDEGWSLIPSLIRNSEGNYKTEKNDIDCFLDKNPNLKQKDIIDQINILQHNGYNTRLLDITKNPLVALKFSLLNYSNTDNPCFYIINVRDDIKDSSQNVNHELERFYNTGEISKKFSVVNARLTSDNIKNQVGDFILFYEPLNLSEFDCFSVHEFYIDYDSINYLSHCCDILNMNVNTIYPSIVNAVSDFKKPVEQVIEAAGKETTPKVKKLEKKKLKQQSIFNNIKI